jgi:threonine synthase
LGEGNVPLYPSARGARYAGAARLGYLHLGMNPTGSFKDLGMTVAVSAAKASGARGVVCASTGNTASSMAAYAARAGMTAHALVPRGRVSKAKLAQVYDYGAHIVEVEGSFDDAFAGLSAIDDSLVVVNSTNPYRLEGQKCAAFAILEARIWSVPDWVIVPGGNLGNISALGKGFREALALGLIDRLPRLAVIQAAGAAPFARAWESGGELVPVIPQTTASAIAVGNPKSFVNARSELHCSHGIAIAVSDEHIDDAKASIGAEGLGCEPASAATLAGARALVSRGIIAPSDDIVLILTGHTLKDPDAVMRRHGLGAVAQRPLHAAV